MITRIDPVYVMPSPLITTKEELCILLRVHSVSDLSWREFVRGDRIPCSYKTREGGRFITGYMTNSPESVRYYQDRGFVEVNPGVVEEVLI